MSRIGKRAIKIPEKVKVNLAGNTLQVEGPLGKMSGELSSNIELEIGEKEIIINRKNDQIQARADHGTARSHIYNMVLGVSKGFSKELIINGVGYKAEMKGQTLHVSVGFSSPKPYEIPQGVKVEIEKGTKVKLSGIDKWLVGKVASEIRKIRPPEPYKEKGIRYSDEIIKKKVGKAAVTQAT